MIILLHEPFDPTISYKELLMFSNKSNMQKALSVMGPVLLRIFARLNCEKLEETIAWIGYAVNDMDNAISCIDRIDPMTFFDIAGYLEKKMK